jgi:hypothetical protein
MADANTRANLRWSARMDVPLKNVKYPFYTKKVLGQFRVFQITTLHGGINHIFV